MAIKATFTLDESTAARLQDAAERLAKPKSEIVRESILAFHERIGRLSDRERASMLQAFDKLVSAIPPRSGEQVRAELDEIRAARRAGGRRSATRKRK